MLINLSTLPNKKWDKNQKKAAEAEFTRVMDIPFPDIDPYASEKEIRILARMYAERCTRFIESKNNPDPVNAIYLMGEMTFCFALVTIFKSRGTRCLASTTMQNTSENTIGKSYRHEFVRFRDY